MDTLYRIADGLKPKEKRYLRRLYLNHPNGEERKRIQLFEMIIAKRRISDIEACKKLYGTKPNSAFSHLKSNLKRDILNFLLTQDSNIQYRSKTKRSRLECNRLLLQGEILLSRGIYKEGQRIMEKALEIALDNEFFSEILRSKEILRNTSGTRLGEKHFDRFSENLHYYLGEYSLYLMVEEFSFRVKLPNEFETNRSFILEQFEEKIQKIRDKVTENSCHTTLFNYFLAEITYASLKKEFSSGLKYGHQLLNFVSNSEVYKGNINNIAGANMTIAGLLIDDYNFKEAIEYSEIAVNTFRTGLNNELKALEYLFFSLYRSGEIQRTEEVLGRALNHPQISKSKLVEGKWRLYESFVLFDIGKLDDALTSLRKNSVISQDREGWGLGFRILEIMITIENGDFYLMTYMLNNYNHHLNRVKGANLARAKVIGQICRSIVKYGDDFDKVIENNESKLKLLTLGIDDYYWNSMSYEVIRFDTWLLSKKKKVAFDH